MRRSNQFLRASTDFLARRLRQLLTGLRRLRWRLQQHWQHLGHLQHAKRVRASRAPNNGSYTSSAAISGIQVCTNDRRRLSKIKGVRVFATRLNSQGMGRQDRDASYVTQFTRDHCRKWETVQMCPADQVAPALNVYYRGRSITGIQLQCRAIEITRVAS